MSDGSWNRQPPQYPSGGMPKRPRPDYDLPPSGASSGHGMLNYLPREEDRGGSRLIEDTKTIGSAYDRYLQSSQNPSFRSVAASNFAGGARLERVVGGGMPGLLSPGDPSILGGRGTGGTDLAPNGRGLVFRGQLLMDPMPMPRPGRDVLPLPPDASNTLFVEGLPSDCSRREVAHIFRPFFGFKEVRLVSKESKHRGGDPLILCFVDFLNAACAATAMSALQGYKMDEYDSDSHTLQLQFARFPGPRSGHGPRGKR